MEKVRRLIRGIRSEARAGGSSGIALVLSMVVLVGRRGVGVLAGEGLCWESQAVMFVHARPQDTGVHLVETPVIIESDRLLIPQYHGFVSAPA